MEKPLILKKYEQKWLTWFKINRWWITIASLAFLPFLGAFVVIGIDSNWLGNNTWFNLERKLWSKPIWEWLDLLIAPIVLALAGFFIRQLLEKQEDERRKLSEKQEDERRKHEALKDYLDDITSLLLSDNWESAVQEKHKDQKNESSNNKTGSQKVFAIAKARTQAALNELDKKRQIQLIQFLSESQELVNFRFPGQDLDLSNSLLKALHLEGADLSLAHFEGSNLWWIKLNNADLQGAHLQRASLNKAQLNNAKLMGARLQGACLAYAHLKDACLINAYLEGACLAYAHLQGADLWGARLEGADLQDIKWNNKTNWMGVWGLDKAENIPGALKPHLIELGVLSPESDNSEPAQPSPEEE